MYQSRGWATEGPKGALRKRARVSMGGEVQEAGLVTSIDEVARVHLADRVGKMVAKQVAALAVKSGLAVGAAAATRSELVGLLTFALLNANNVPDLRAWLSLPAEFQIARFRVPAGRHSLTVEAGGMTSTHEVEVKPRRTGLLVLRRY